MRAALQLQQVKSTTGRPTLLTSRELRHVVREAATGAYTSIQLANKLELKCSARTVHRIHLGVYWLVYTKNGLHPTSHRLAQDIEIALGQEPLDDGNGLGRSYFLG